MTKINRAFVCVALVLVASVLSVGCGAEKLIGPTPTTTSVPPAFTATQEFDFRMSPGVGVGFSTLVSGTIKVELTASPDGPVSVELWKSTPAAYLNKTAGVIVEVRNGRGSAEIPFIGETNTVRIRMAPESPSNMSGRADIDGYR